jgi:RNA polymerase sigma-54 factor
LLSYAHLRRQSGNANYQDEEYNYRDNVKAKPQNLSEFLMSQLNLLRLSTKDYDIAQLLIQNIDKRGFIGNYDKIRDEIVAKFEVEERKVHSVLKVIQTFEPEGVAARSVKECLLIQVEEYNFEHEELRAILKKVITYHFEDLAEQKFAKIASQLKIPEAGVQRIADFIKTNLTPNPGAAFSGDTEHVVIPSFLVEVAGEKIIFTNLEKTKGVQVSISDKYLQILNNQATDQATKTFLTEKLEKAKLLVDNLQQRYENLEKLAKLIVTKQEHFLRQGEDYLEPLLQKDISMNLGVSTSTVSRLVSAKFIQTPFGIYALKALCPRNHFGKTSQRFKAIIQDFFRKYPQFSDIQIAKQLKEAEGVIIARRTVAKYRQELGLANKYHR